MNERRRKPAHPGDRTLILETRTPHMEGWVLYGMSRKLPDDACSDMQAGYSDHRETAISALLAQEQSA